MNSVQVLPLLIAGSILLSVFMFFLVAYLVVQKSKQNAYQIEKNNLIFEHQSRLLRAQIEEQERTLDSISKELHDNVGQLLSFIRMNMHLVRKLATDKEQMAPIQTASTILEEVIRDVHHISHSLNSEFIKGKGLQNILEKEADYINASGKLKCNIDVKDEFPKFPPEHELMIFRIAQEVINNVIKHAQATTLSITMENGNEGYVISFHDNGVGFDGSKLADLKGIGFINMHERARMVGGAITVASVQGEGCTIRLEITGRDAISE